MLSSIEFSMPLCVILKEFYTSEFGISCCDSCSIDVYYNNTQCTNTEAATSYRYDPIIHGWMNTRTGIVPACYLDSSDTSLNYAIQTLPVNRNPQLLGTEQHSKPHPFLQYGVTLCCDTTVWHLLEWSYLLAQKLWYIPWVWQNHLIW